MRERAIVLVVDDEAEVCTSLRRLLESAGLEESLAHLIHISKQLGLSFRGREGGDTRSTPPPKGSESPKVFAGKEISLDSGMARSQASLPGTSRWGGFRARFCQAQLVLFQG